MVLKEHVQTICMIADVEVFWFPGVFTLQVREEIISSSCSAVSVQEKCHRVVEMVNGVLIYCKPLNAQVPRSSCRSCYKLCETFEQLWSCSDVPVPHGSIEC